MLGQKEGSVKINSAVLLSDCQMSSLKLLSISKTESVSERNGKEKLAP